jgi:hypothetical protein
MAQQSRFGALCLLPLSLTACGGGGGGGVVSTPPPPPVAVAPTPAPTPTPTPTPPPPPVPPPPSGPIGLISDVPFAVQAVAREAPTNSAPTVTDANAAVEFRYDAAANAYEVKLPGLQQGRLQTRSYNGGFDANGWTSVDSSNNNVLTGSNGTAQPVTLTLNWPSRALNPQAVYSYSGWGYWTTGNRAASPPFRAGVFAYGIATPSGGIPRTGSASYAASVLGETEGASFDNATAVGGKVSLLFDFAAGTLSGSMRPELCPWDCIDLGEYRFKDTIFAPGSTTFAGSFAVDGTTLPSFFSGNFNGPGAAELIARWRAPYRESPTASWGMMSGVWVGKKK